MDRRVAALAISIILILVAFCGTAWLFIRPIVKPVQSDTITRCGNPASPGYRACEREAAETFRTVDYAETKDLAKSFLTIVIAVFVASVTFSEKIVDLKNAPRLSVIAMVLCWLLLLISIASCGAGLARDFVAMYKAEHYYSDPFEEHFAVQVMFAWAGFAFAAALVSLFVAGLPSLFRRPSADS